MTSFNLIYPKKFHSCTLRYILVLILVHIGTNVHLFELQICPYKGTIVYIFLIVFCVFCVYSTWILAHSHTTLFCSVLLYSPCFRN